MPIARKSYGVEILSKTVQNKVSWHEIDVSRLSKVDNSNASFEISSKLNDANQNHCPRTNPGHS